MFPFDEYRVTPGSLLGTFVLYAVLVAAAWLFSGHSRWLAKRAQSRGKKITYRARAVGIFALSFTLGTILTNGVIYGASTMHDTSRVPSVSAVEAADIGFGLKSGTAYPLILGDRISGTSGEVSISGGFFRARASANLTPGSAVSVEFSRGKDFYILEIPVSKSTFRQSTSEPPSITLHLNPVSDYGFYGRRVFDTSRECTSVVKTGVVVCERVITSTVDVNDRVLETGLANLLTQTVDDVSVLRSATFVLTPEMYDQIMGKNG